MGDSDAISGLGSRSSIVHAVPDAEQRGLSPDEAALASCAGSGRALGEVISRSGLPEPRAIALLLGLRMKGIIGQGPQRAVSTPRPGAAPAPATAVAPRAAAPAARPPAAAPKSAPAKGADEVVDLDEARKREILEADARCESDDFFSILQVPPGSAPADVKKAYYELSKRFHPDRFFGKELGSFRERVDRIFKRFTEAQGVLTDPARRAAYLAEHPELAPPKPPPEPVAEGPRLDERRARLARHPYLSRFGKVHGLVARAKEAIAAGDYSRATGDLHTATQIDPKNREAAELLIKAKKASDRVRCESAMKEAKAAESVGDMNLALNHYRSASNLDPENALAAHKAASILGRAGPEMLKEATQFARKAAELAPDNADYRSAYAGLLARAGLEKNAQREYEAVLKLRPDDAFAKDQLRKLKWKL